MNEEILNTVKEIKRSFRLMMNGPSSQSMREKGLDYKVNWGVPLMQLRQEATKYGKNFDLAIELWKDDVRECKILATLIMPADKMSAELVDVWMEDVHSQELAEIMAFNLLQYLNFAPALAYQWISMDDDIKEIAGYTLLARLFMKGQEPNERGINEFLDQCSTALNSKNMGVRHSAANCANRFAGLGIVYERLTRSALKINL